MEEDVKRDSFLFYETYFDVLEYLDDADALLYIRTICKYFFRNEEIPETTGSKMVDVSLLSIRKVMEANNKNFKNSVRGGAPKGNKNAVKNNLKTTENNSKTTQNNLETTKNNLKQPVDLQNNPQNNPLFSKQPNVNVNVNVNDNVNEKENEDGCFSSLVLEPFYDEDKQKNYSGRLSKEEAEEISLDDLYELDKDVLIDDKFSVNEYVDGFKDIKGYAFQYELPGSWGRNLKQLFKEAMYNEYGKDAQLK